MQFCYCYADIRGVGVHMLYVYDALVCGEKDSKLVAETRIILEHGIKTASKLSSSETDSPILKANLDGIEERIVIDASNITHSLRVKAIILERMKNGEELIFVDAVIEFGKMI